LNLRNFCIIWDHDKVVENVRFGKMLLPVVLLCLHFVGMKEEIWFFYIKICPFFFFSIRFLFRLYWYPMKVLYSAGVVTAYRAYDKGCGLYGFFNGLLWILLALNIYWLIVSILFKIKSKLITFFFSLFFNFFFECVLAL
jgi:hypothetical protein